MTISSPHRYPFTINIHLRYLNHISSFDHKQSLSNFYINIHLQPRPRHGYQSVKFSMRSSIYSTREREKQVEAKVGGEPLLLNHVPDDCLWQFSASKHWGRTNLLRTLMCRGPNEIATSQRTGCDVRRPPASTTAAASQLSSFALTHR